MVIVRVRFVLLFAASLLAGCAGGMTETASPASTTLAGTPLSELPPQPMRPGQCTLVLWSRGNPPLRFLMAFDTPATARVFLDGEVVELPRVSESGALVSGHFPEQFFARDALSLNVSFSTDESGVLEDGMRVSSASVEYSGPTGWTALIPAAGLIACSR